MKSLRQYWMARLLPIGLFAIGLLVVLIFTAEQPHRMNTTPAFLCLGDSYTIGESVMPGDNFPNQTVRLLRQSNSEIEDPEIIARTGWTTDELQTAIDHHQFKPSYGFVTLLIGVNNQYRERPLDEYKVQFESLLKQAIGFAGNQADKVIVLSIPDWGITPFAKSSGRDQEQISRQIDVFNTANKLIADQYHVNYLNITPGTRDALHDDSLLASDGLHPSAKEYQRWATQLAEVIKTRL